MSEFIRLLLSNLPVILFVAAFAASVLVKHPAHYPTRLLGLLLLLSVGVECAWAGFFHVAFPHIAARSIGWEVSPFQFEIGIADLAIGLVAILSYWRSLAFKGAVVGYIVLFYAGVAVGHIRDAIVSGNFAANNFGPLLAMTVVKVILLTWLYHSARKEAARKADLR